MKEAFNSWTREIDSLIFFFKSDPAHVKDVSIVFYFVTLYTRESRRLEPKDTSFSTKWRGGSPASPRDVHV